MRIRRATSADAGAIVAMLGRFMAMHAAMNPWRYVTQEEPAVAFRRALSDPGERVLLWLIAERPGPGGEAVGYLMAEEEAEDAMLWYPTTVVVHDVYVEESVRGGGVGRRLMDEALAWARQRGAEQVRLYTDEQNLAARARFAKLGFVQTMREMSLRLGGGRGPERSGGLQD